MIKSKEDVRVELQHIVDSGINEKRIYDLIVRMSSLDNATVEQNMYHPKRIRYISDRVVNSNNFEYQVDLIWFEVNLFDAIRDMELTVSGGYKQKLINLELDKAAKWDKLDKAISKFYEADDSDDEADTEDDEFVLDAVGETAAIAFGYM